MRLAGTLKISVTCLMCLTALILSLWYVAVPEGLIEVELKKVVKPPVELEVIGLKKGLLFNVAINKVHVFIDKHKAGELQAIEIAFNPLYIFSGKVPVDYKMETSGGVITGKGMYDLRLPAGGGLAAAGEFTGIQLGMLYDAYGDGRVTGSYTIKAKDVDVEFTVQDYRAKIRGWKLADLLLAYFDGIRGKLTITGKGITAYTISLTGKGIYARVKGEPTDNSGRNITIELMPEASFKGMEAMKALKHYETTPGLYIIKIRQK
ncbi:MAG: hypothetical protein HQL01_08735 [Nitrospirae bacterium]|nr:hypothetical protein [Nitrospirota bacterium]